MELLVVLAIIGIIVLLALPNFMGVVSEARSLEAQQQLNHLYLLQRNYFFKEAKYSSDLVEVRFEQAKLSTEGGNANYVIEVIESGVSSFKARAIAIVDFDGDGVFNEWVIDENQKLEETVRD
jgi:type IV pilus assembly protein PilE